MGLAILGEPVSDKIAGIYFGRVRCKHALPFQEAAVTPSLSSVMPLWRLAPPRLWRVQLLLLVLVSLSEGAGMLLLVPILQSLQADPGGAQQLVPAWHRVFAAAGLGVSLGSLLTLFLLLVGVRSALQYCRHFFGARLQFDLVDSLRQRCFGALLRSEWRWMSSARKSDHANVLLTDVNRIGAGLQAALGLAAALVTTLVYLAAALALAWDMTALAVFSAALVFAALSGQRGKALRLGQELGGAQRALQAQVQESMDGIKLAKILHGEQRHLDAFRAISASVHQQQMSFVAGTGMSQALFQTGGALLLAMFLYLGLAWRHTPLAELLTLVVLFARLIPLFSSMQQQHLLCLHALAACDAAARLLAACQAAAEPAAAAGVAPWPVAQAVSLRDASVHYAGRTRPALDKVALVFPAGSTTLVMGESGAGKSSLSDVLMGLLALDQGVLLVDTVPVVGEQRMRWRHSVAYVPQETFLLHDTIRNNLLWGAHGASDAELREALAQAAAGFVHCLPQGLDSIVGDRGVLLSGGERQRLALARALLARPSLLILDEATSALDRDNEMRICEAIEALHGKLIVIIISHRLMTLAHVDQVLILKGGRVASLRGRDSVEPARGAMDGIAG
jgi:ATP-binding cassette subfamily C protein